MARLQAAAWAEGRLALPDGTQSMPDRPARPERPHLLAANLMPKRGRGGSAAGRFALLHALAHIELNAIDLAWDIVGRFGAGLPPSFCDDWIKVADDEARHFVLLADRLEALGGRYGDLPAHDGLWDAAFSTRHDLLARLAVVPMVLEARGLDVTPQTVKRLREHGDEASAAILDIIYADEISHVACGVRWFLNRCKHLGADAQTTFESGVRTHFRGSLKPPFNHAAREKAGFYKYLYASLASPASICHASTFARDSAEGVLGNGLAGVRGV